MIDLVFAHPYPKRSRANRILLNAVRDISNLDVRSLYDIYPDFGIDVESEQAALLSAKLVVWQHPLYWYTAPGLMKHWFDKVLARGWAYGEGGSALHGKLCQWVVTTGGDQEAYSATGMHAFNFESFVPVMRQTAEFCGMKWLEPIVVHNAHRVSDKELHAVGRDYRKKLISLATEAQELVVHG
ncbi:MAG: glutathione-regulated potassium-efflux system oxidoreductase KefF [Sandaracinaceae bacterium]|jgi:glutathione-regulated potassium-efflux system ancillary protein KefF|nr:glutathione-regulated potassium-efflux system oxidoreductase KefF [Sandaracinaceae bacterium]